MHYWIGYLVYIYHTSAGACNSPSPVGYGTDSFNRTQGVQTMLTIDLYNPTGKTTSRALLELLHKAFQRRYAIITCWGRDPIAGRNERTRKGYVSGELYADESGLEVAFFGYWLMLGVETKQGHETS
jgi:hypothetical protein